MCGRVRLSSDVSEIKLVFSIPPHRPTPNIAPSWNVAPTDPLPVVRYDAKAGERSLDVMRWGLVPFWAKDIKVGFANINAKAEGIEGKPAFREAFQRRRCLVPVDNFYEWKKTPTGKQPYAVALADRRLMALAGLWQNWRSPAGEWVRSFAIITTTPNELCAELHDRMPVALKPDMWPVWLGEEPEDPSQLKALLAPYPSEEMVAWPVSPRVGNVKNNDASLIEPLEEQANRAGLQATVVRSAEEFLDTEQCRYLEDLPLVHIEKIADADPEPFMPRPETPLGGVRALGFSHVIAGPGMGRGLAYHGADVLNLWTPDDFEMDFNYYSANVGMRSAIMDFRRSDEMARFRQLVTGADIFFANRRPGLLEKLGITSSELARLRPGIVQVDFSIYGAVGPWANRIGFDQTAGSVSGVLALEGSVEEPKLPEIFVVNDYISSWIGMVGAIAALRCRATEGGSYRVRVSLARVSLWLLQMGIFDKSYASDVAGGAGDHAYPDPDLFQVDTPCGHYQGVTDQVVMSGTPGFFAVSLVPRGSSKAEWLAPDFTR